MRPIGTRAGTGIDWAVAREVHALRTGIGLLELCERMGGVDRGTMSRVIRRLEARQVVTVGGDSTDGRRIVIKPGPVAASEIKVPAIVSHQVHVAAMKPLQCKLHACSLLLECQGCE